MPHWRFRRKTPHKHRNRGSCPSELIHNCKTHDVTFTASGRRHVVLQTRASSLTLIILKTFLAAATDDMIFRTSPGCPAAINMQAYCTNKNVRCKSGPSMKSFVTQSISSRLQDTGSARPHKRACDTQSFLHLDGRTELVPAISFSKKAVDGLRDAASGVRSANTLTVNCLRIADSALPSESQQSVHPPL